MGEWLEGAQGEAGVGSGSGGSKRGVWGSGGRGAPSGLVPCEPRPEVAPRLGPAVSVCSRRAGGAISPAICLDGLSGHLWRPPVCSPRSNCLEISITAVQMTGAGGWAVHTCEGSPRLSDDSVPWAAGAGAASCATHHCPLLDVGTILCFSLKPACSHSDCNSQVLLSWTPKG